MNGLLLALGLAISLAAGAANAKPAASAEPTGWKAVLIAGDDHERAFDNGVDAMAAKLATFGVPGSNISVLKASAYDAHGATQSNIRRAFAELRPGPTDGCFVFVTSHGGEGRGLALVRDGLFLSPAELGGLLKGACGNRPTVVVASGCYSGSFAAGSAMPAANRVILTAARRDRPSFGCDAGRRYTVFDQCMLKSLERGIRWAEVMGRTRRCVATYERESGDVASQPQLSVGRAVDRLKVFTP